MLWPPPLMLSNTPWSREPTAAATWAAEVGGGRARGSRPCRSRPARRRPSPLARANGTRPASQARKLRRQPTKPPSSPATSMALPHAPASSAGFSALPVIAPSLWSAPRYAVTGATGGIRPTQWPLMAETAGTVDVRCDDDAIVEDFESCYRLRTAVTRATTASSSSPPPRRSSTAGRAARPPTKRANVRFTPRRPPRNRPASAPASAAAPTRPRLPDWNWRADLVRGHALDRRRHRRPRRRPRARQAIGLQRSPSSATLVRAGWRKPGRTGARPARQHGPAPDRVDRHALAERPWRPGSIASASSTTPSDTFRLDPDRDADRSKRAPPVAGGGGASPELPGALRRGRLAALPRSARRPGLEDVSGYLSASADPPPRHRDRRADPEPRAVRCVLRLDDLRDLARGGRCRRLLDLDADPLAIAEALRHDEVIGGLVRARPGLRVPGCVDGDELALRTVLGQRASLQAARTRTARLSKRSVRRWTSRWNRDTSIPAAAVLAEADPKAFAGLGLRRDALQTLAARLANGELRIDAGSDPRKRSPGYSRFAGSDPGLPRTWRCEDFTTPMRSRMATLAFAAHSRPWAARTTPAQSRSCNSDGGPGVHTPPSSYGRAWTQLPPPRHNSPAPPPKERPVDAETRPFGTTRAQRRHSDEFSLSR